MVRGWPMPTATSDNLRPSPCGAPRRLGRSQRIPPLCSLLRSASLAQAALLAEHLAGSVAPQRIPPLCSLLRSASLAQAALLAEHLAGSVAPQRIPPLCSLLRSASL